MPKKCQCVNNKCICKKVKRRPRAQKKRPMLYDGIIGGRIIVPRASELIFPTYVNTQTQAPLGFRHRAPPRGTLPKSTQTDTMAVNRGTQTDAVDYTQMMPPNKGASLSSKSNLDAADYTQMMPPNKGASLSSKSNLDAADFSNIQPSKGDLIETSRLASQMKERFDSDKQKL